MPYDPELVKPMREELTSLGVTELLTAEEVDTFLAENSGTTLVVVNSVCGCAAGMARPAVRTALAGDHAPDRTCTVFAGQDLDATARARSFFEDYPPSSPSFALLKDGEVVHFVPRHRIEGHEVKARYQDGRPRVIEWTANAYIRKVHFRDLNMIEQIEQKVVNRLRQVTSAIRQAGANQVDIITSAAEKEAGALSSLSLCVSATWSRLSSTSSNTTV